MLKFSREFKPISTSSDNSVPTYKQGAAAHFFVVAPWCSISSLYRQNALVIGLSDMLVEKSSGVKGVRSVASFFSCDWSNFGNLGA